MEKTLLQLRTSKDEANKIIAAAKADNRSISSYLKHYGLQKAEEILRQK